MRPPPKKTTDVSRPIAALMCLISVAFCLVYAWLRSELPTWWRNNGGGVPYVIFWILLAFTCFPHRRHILPICVTATMLTCGLEFLQLWKPEPLQAFRSTTFGAALLGNQFTWHDLPPYFIGGLIGFLLLKLVSALTIVNAPAVCHGET